MRAVMFVLQFACHQSILVIRVFNAVFKRLLTLRHCGDRRPATGDFRDGMELHLDFRSQIEVARPDEALGGALIQVVGPVIPTEARVIHRKRHFCIAGGAPEVLLAPAWVIAGINQNGADSVRA